MRRSIFAYSQAEVKILTDAFNVLKENGTYDEYVRRHHQAMSFAHRGPLFLPWHRKFIEEIEDDLRAVDGRIEALPYWPWTQGNGQLFTDAWFGPNGDPNNGFRVLSGPFAHWRALILNTGTGQLQPRSTTGIVRQLGNPASPTEAQLRSALSLSSYPSFEDTIEGWPGGPILHNEVHARRIAGDMGFSTSPNDPMFFLNHGNVDRGWWIGQKLYGLGFYSGPTGPMSLLRGNPTPAEMFDIHNRGYGYQ